MKVKTKIRSLVLLILAFCLSVIFGIVTVKTVNHKTAFGATATTAELEVSGMSLRYEDGKYEKAVRFHVTMPTDTYRKTVYAGAESGVLIIPNALLKGNELTLSTEGAQNGIFSNAKTNVWAKNSNGEYEARLVLNNIPQSNYGTKLAVRAYYTQDGVTTYSETYNTGSLAAVALMERDASDDPSNDKIQKLVEDYATFNVTINDKVFEVVYGEKAPFAGALTLTNKAGTVNWDPERAVTGNVVLKATGASAVLEDQEIDLDINNDGSLNTTNKVAFDLSALNLSSLTYGTDYSLTAVTVGGVPYDVSGATVSGNLLQIPASVFGYIYGEKEVGLTFNYKALGIESSATATAKFISKKISNKAELDAMNAIMTKYHDEEANTYGGYFVLDNNIVYNETIKDGTSGNVWTPLATNLDTNGFVGTFDGRGYAIDGLFLRGVGTGVFSAFIIEIGVGGTVKNVAFTNTVTAMAASVVTARNDGLIENVYVHSFAFGTWMNASGNFNPYNNGWMGTSQAAFNGGDTNANGQIKNVFVDMTDSAKKSTVTNTSDASYNKSWHDYTGKVYILGKGQLSTYEGVYAVGIPDNGYATGVYNKTQSDDLNWYVNEDAFDVAYGAENSAIKAEIDTWPLWLQDLLPINVPTVQVEKQTIDLNVQVNGIKASLNETATATLDFSSVCDDLGKVMSVTYGDGIAVADVEVDGATLTFPVKQFGWAGGEEEFTVITENVKYSVPVILATKVLKTAQDIDDMNHIAKAMEADFATFGGYFTLGNDIAYNGNYVPMMDYSLGVKLPYSKLNQITTDADGYAMYNGRYLWSDKTWALIQNPDSSKFANVNGNLQYADGNVRSNNSSTRARSMGWTGTGFIGTFDGCGYTIDGMTVGNGEITYSSFIPLLGATGVIKNVAFTNAGLNNSGSGSGFLNLMGIAGSTIENVYVQLTSIEGSSNIAATIAATDNTRSNTGVQATNVFIDTTAIGSMSSNFYAVGGSSTANAFISYENVYAAVNNATQQTNAFGKGGAVSKTNTGVYVGKQTFSDEYNANATLKAAFDETNAILNGVMDAMFLAEMTISTQEIDLGVSMVNGVATVAESAEIDVFEAADGLTEVISLTYGGAAISGATVNDSTLTLPLDSFNIKNFGAGSDLVLQAKNAVGKTYIITIPTTIVTKVIYNAADLDEMNHVAKALNSHSQQFDGYFALGNDIAYNGNYVPMMDFSAGSSIPYSKLGEITFDADGYAMYHGKYLWSAWKLIQNPDPSLFTCGEDKHAGKLQYNGSNVMMNNASPRSTSMGWEGNGFIGTFDGRGYTIDGMTVGDGEIQYCSFIPVLGATGVIKNVAFTNAGLNNKGTGSGFLNLMGIAGSTIENVYVQLTSIEGSGNIAATIAATDNTRSNTGVQATNVFIDTTAIGSMSSNFYAVGGSSTANAFISYENVYAAVNNATQQTNAFGKGGAVSKTNTGVYVGKQAFSDEYNANATLQAAFDATNEILNGVMDAMFLVEAAVSTKEINLDVSMVNDVATATESVSLDVSEATNELTEVVSLAYGGQTISGASINGSTLTLPLASISIETYGTGEDLVLQAKNAVGKTYVITIPTTFVTKVIYDAADLDEFGFVAAAVGNAKHGRSDGKISDGYFKLGQNIAYNGTYIAWQRRGSDPLWWDTGAAQGFAGTFDGCGYTIDGMTAGTGYKPDDTIAGNAAFIPVLHEDGIIRNLAFTNAGINNNNSAGGFLTAAGQGLIENVYVQMTSASGFSVGGVLFGTDNVRGVSGPTARNVFVDTTAITTHYAGASFYAVGGNSSDKIGADGKEYPQGTPADQYDGVIEPFGIYDGVYALVAINEERDYAGTAFGAGGAYAGSQNYAAYAGIEAFAATYWDDAEMKDTIDALQAMFGFDLNLENYYPKEINLEETQNANLNVATDLTIADSVSLDLSKAGDELGELRSAKLTNGGSAYALRSASKEIEGATLEGTTLTIPTEGNLSVTEHGDYLLTVKTTKSYIITLPVSIVSNVITTKEELDGFGEIALAIGGGNGVYDGYFKLGADIEYNETVKVKTDGNVWNPWFGIGAAGDLPFTVYNSLNEVTGFKGIFDGDGYSIHGWRSHFKSGWYTNGFITKVAEEGIIRNVAFTDVVNGGMSSVITAQNDGLIENVYVHYYTNGAWISSAGRFVEFNEGWTSEATATFNGANTNATGTIRNVVVDMSESAKLNYTDGNTNASYGLSWLDDPQTVCPLGRAVNATYEGVYAIGIPDSHAYVMSTALSTDVLGWYKDAASASAKYYNNDTVKAIINGLDKSFWKVIDGVASYKYADSKTPTELDLDLVLSGDKTSAAPANATLDLNVGKNLGTLTSATFKGADLGGVYNAETGSLTVNSTVFGYAYGDQVITLTFTDGNSKAHTFDVAVLLVTKTLKTKDDITNFGYISKLCESDTKKWGGYFKLGNDINYGGAGYVGFINPSGNTANTLTGDLLGWGWTLGNGFIGTFDGCGHTIDKLWLNSESSCRSFISVLGNGGVIRNVAFTNARKGGSGGFVASGGTGLIENVYVKMDIFGTNSAGGNDGWVSGDGIGVFFATPNGDAAISLKNCFVDASSAQVGATNTLYDRVGAIASLGNASNTTKKYTGAMSGVYLISDAAGNIQALRDMNTTEATLAGTTGVTTHKGTEAFLAAYNSATQTREDIRNLPEWMKALIFGGEATEPAALANFIEKGMTDYAVVIGEKDALGNAYSVQAGAPIHKAYNFLISQVEKATGVKLEKSAAGDNAQHRIVIGDWTLFEDAGLALGDGEYGVFVQNGTVYIMAYNAEDYHPAILKFLEVALGYRAYAMSGVGSSTATLTDGTKMQDTTFDGFIEYLNVNNGAVASLADSNYTNVTAFEYRSNGAWNQANVDGLYSMGNSVFKENYGEWHNTFKFVDPAVAHTVNGNTYAAYTDSFGSTFKGYATNSWISNPQITYTTATHPWFASSYSTYYEKSGLSYKEAGPVDKIQTGAEASPYQLCYTAHGDATAYSDLVAYIGGQLIAMANEHPEYEIFNFTQQDNSYACQCNTCTAKGMPSDAFLAFLDDLLAYVNNEANGLTRSPIKIAYFAYNAYLPVPTSYDYDTNTEGTQLNPNTYLVLAPIGAYYDEAMNEGTNATENAWVSGSGNSAWNSDWSDVAAWLTMTNDSGVKVYLWTYEINQYAWFTARDSFEAQIANYKLFANYSNIEVMATEHLWHNANVSAFGQLKAYMNSKAMMDPDGVTYQGLVNEFFGRNADGTFTGKGYYGPAGEYMYNMYLEMRGDLADFDGSMPNGKGKPYIATDLGWKKAQIETLLGYINSANTAIDNSGVSDELKAIYKEHILIESLMPRFIDADKKLGAGYSNLNEYRTAFLQDAKAFGYAYYGSGADPSMYALENDWFGSNTVYTVAPKTYY